MGFRKPILNDPHSNNFETETSLEKESNARAKQKAAAASITLGRPKPYNSRKTTNIEIKITKAPQNDSSVIRRILIFKKYGMYALVDRKRSSRRKRRLQNLARLFFFKLQLRILRPTHHFHSRT